MYVAACQDILSYPVVVHDMGLCDVDVYVISGFQGILDLLRTFGLCSSRWAFAPKHPCQAFVQVEVEVNKILQKDMLAEAPLEQKTFYQLFCYAEDDWKIQALRALRPGVAWGMVAGHLSHLSCSEFSGKCARPTVPTTRQTMYLLQACHEQFLNPLDILMSQHDPSIFNKNIKDVITTTRLSDFCN